jgi:hypothetical protein
MNDDDDQLPDYDQATGTVVRVNPLNISASGQPTPPADEGIEMGFEGYNDRAENVGVGQWRHVPTQQDQVEQVEQWGFEKLNRQDQLMNSPGRNSSNDSTRVEGNGGGSDGSVDEGLGFEMEGEGGEMDPAMFSDVHDASMGGYGGEDDGMRRNVRESAPPPQEQEVEMVPPGLRDQDSDDDLPIAEIPPPA